MNDELFERVLVQLQPELAQELGCAILEDRKKLKAFEIIKENYGADILKKAYKQIYAGDYCLLKEILK